MLNGKHILEIIFSYCLFKNKRNKFNSLDYIGPKNVEMSIFHMK